MGTKELSPREWIDGIETGLLKPDLVDEDNGFDYEKAWTLELDDARVVYYEQGKFKDQALRMFLGLTATSDLRNRSPEEIETILLNSATSPIFQRSEVKNRLERILNLEAGSNRQPKPHNSQERNPNFVVAFSKLSGLDREVINDLGLQNFRTQPFFTKSDKCVYVVSRFPIHEQWPAIRYNRANPSWQCRDLQLADALSVNSAFEDSEYRASLIRNNGWRDIDKGEIIQITDEITRQQAQNSL